MPDANAIRVLLADDHAIMREGLRLLLEGEEIFVVDVSDDSIQSRWHAQRVMNALRAKSPLEHIAREVVVLIGESRRRLAFGSSPDAEAFVRSLMPQLSGYKWQSKELDW